MSSGRILLVEDNRDNQTLIADMLQTLNYEVSFAGDGQQALRLASTALPDLILMDLSLPIMDDWTAAGHLKADPGLAHIPVIALTAHAMAGDRERALQAGCDDYVSKPINLPELSMKIAQWMAARKPS